MDAYIYVLHSGNCRYKANKFYKGCRCRKWIYEYGTRKRYSAKTRSWERAEKLIANPESKPTGVTISDAVKDYLSDKRETNLSTDWLDTLTLDGERLKEWCAEKGCETIPDLGLSELKDFRKTWKGNPLTRAKRQERLRSFLRYCKNQGWISANPAKLLSKIKVDTVPTDYFEDDEFAKILAAVDIYHPRGADIAMHRERARAMLMLLRWSGLRIGDASRLERRRLGSDGRLLLYMAKTKEPVYVRLPDDVCEMLRALQNSNPVYFFWSGTSDRKTVVDDWWRTLSRIFKRAKLDKRAHPHMMRDTFAVNFLISGGMMEELQMLLGHKSIKTTQKHYSPWSKTRQDKLDEAVRKSWG